MSKLEELLEQTIRRYVRPDAQIVGLDTHPLRESERGYSGARLERHIVAIRVQGGETATTTLITKDAALIERRVLTLLAAQGQCVPFSHTLDLIGDRPALLCQQDLGDSLPQASSAELDCQVARCLARIHYANLGRAKELAWLPRADHAYFEDDILADYRTQLAWAMEHPAFVAEYGDLARRMDDAVLSFPNPVLYSTQYEAFGRHV